MMASDDWYRNTEWSKEIESIFFAKLKRSRSQREQYLVIQALTIAARDPVIALQLVEHYFATRHDKFEDMRALLAKSTALLRLDKIDEAMQTYRDVLAREEEFPNHQSTTYVEYPYIVAINKGSRLADFDIF